MNKLLVLGALSVTSLIVGCKTTDVDEWRSDLKTSLCPAKFKPVYEVMKDKGIVSGEASESWTFWFITDGPDTYAREIGGPIYIGDDVREAAFEDACAKSGATILLAPRFTVTKDVGWFWFSGSRKVRVEGVPARLIGAEEVKTEDNPKPRTCCCGCCGK